MRMRFNHFEGEVEEVSCPTCGPGVPAKLVFKDKDGIGFYQCSQCNIQYASPRFIESSLLDIYENENWMDTNVYADWSYEKWKQSGDLTYHLVNQNVRLLQENLPAGARVLDLGCGTGLTVRHGTELGFQMEGLEPSSLISGIAREKVGAKVHCTQIEDFKTDKLYDGVLILDVLEHLYDPVRVLRSAAALLKPGGYLFIHVPHHRGLGNLYKAWLCHIGLKKRFKHFGFPWHIYSFDRKSLTAILAKVGIKPQAYESWSQLLTEGKINLFTAFPIWAAKKLARSDYIVCIARKQ